MLNEISVVGGVKLEKIYFKGAEVRTIGDHCTRASELRQFCTLSNKDLYLIGKSYIVYLSRFETVPKQEQLCKGSKVIHFFENII